MQKEGRKKRREGMYLRVPRCQERAESTPSLAKEFLQSRTGIKGDSGIRKNVRVKFSMLGEIQTSSGCVQAAVGIMRGTLT
jgi:hypothetical protein